MITLIKLLSLTFKIPALISLFFIVLTILAVIGLCYVIIVILLDLTYRPNLPQYPYNIIMDRIIPLLALCLPTILILSLNLDKDTTWIQKCAYIIILHSFVLVPLFYLWSKHRHWNYSNTNFATKSWNSPKLYLDLTIVIIYPAFWGFILNYFRYLRLGNELDLTTYVNSTLINFLIVLLFLWPFTSFWFFTLLGFFTRFRKILWEEFSNFIISITLFLLRYKVIFKLLEKLYQFSFLWITFVICDPHIYRNKSYIRKQIHRLYLKPYRFWIFILFIIVAELLYSQGKLYYSIHFLLIFLFLRVFIQFLNTLGGPTNNWVQLCCYSDYMSYNWEKPHYPKSFWLWFHDMRESFNQYPPLSSNVNNNLLP